MLRGFISYSHEDRLECERLAAHLVPLRRLNLIDFWADKRIFPGADWAQNINEALEACDVMAVLVSVNSFQSLGVQHELKRALEREALGQCRVVPILLKSFMWRAWPELYQKQPFPEWNRFLDDWHPPDGGLYRTAQGFESLVQQMESQA